LEVNVNPTHPPRSVRRLPLAIAIGIAVLVSSLGLFASPASAFAPSAPRPILAIGYKTFVRVHWAPPLNDGGKPVTSYRIERFAGGNQVPDKVWTRSTSAPLVDTSAVVDVQYSYRVQAKTADGESTWVAMPVKLNDYQTELWSFGGDATDFVDRQYQDFLGRLPTPAERTQWISGFGLKTTTGTVIDALVNDPARVQLRHPLLRIYKAYFDRAPDHGGLDYWVAKRKNGTKLNEVSSAFAASSEFKNTYGALSNGEFVTLVYENVLDRTPDAGGYAHWKGQLDTNKATRGQVMTQFSESSEFKTASRGFVLAADVYDDMLDKANGGSELDLWSSHIQGGGNVGDYGTRITLLNAY